MILFWIAMAVIFSVFVLGSIWLTAVRAQEKREQIKRRARRASESNPRSELSTIALLRVPPRLFKSFHIRAEACRGKFRLDHKRERLVVVNRSGSVYVGFATQANMQNIAAAKLEQLGLDHRLPCPFADLRKQSIPRKSIIIDGQEIEVYPAWFDPNEIDEDWCFWARLQAEYLAETQKT